VNRAQRRAGGRQRPPLVQTLHGINDEVTARQGEFLAHARQIRAAVPYPGESIEESVIALSQMIEELSSPIHSIVAGPALEELRAARDELAAQLVA
jgi:hypothetical protein